MSERDRDEKEDEKQEEEEEGEEEEEEEEEEERDEGMPTVVNSRCRSGRVIKRQCQDDKSLFSSCENAKRV